MCSRWTKTVFFDRHIRFQVKVRKQGPNILSFDPSSWSHLRNVQYISNGRGSLLRKWPTCSWVRTSPVSSSAGKSWWELSHTECRAVAMQIDARHNSIVTLLQAGARNVVLRTILLLVSRKNIVLSFWCYVTSYCDAKSSVQRSPRDDTEKEAKYIFRRDIIGICATRIYTHLPISADISSNQIVSSCDVGIVTINAFPSAILPTVTAVLLWSSKC